MIYKMKIWRKAKGGEREMRLMLLLGMLLILWIAFYFSLPRTLFRAPYSTVVTDRNGELLGARIADDGQWRFPPSDTVPERFRICITQFEDRYFRYHWGVNPLSMARALVQNVRYRRILSGGSTLTMQVIRLSRSRPRTFWEKCIEMSLAVRLEFRYSKKKILALYASHAPFGGNVVGLEGAAWRYFGRPAFQLSWAEAATLAVLPNAPSMIHLARNREALAQKRDRLLKRLFNKHIIDSITYETSLMESLPEQPLPLPQYAPHLVSRYSQTQRGSYHVSSIDKGLQIHVEELLERWNDELLRSDIRNIAAIVLDVENGLPLVYCGNVRFDALSSGNQVDVIRAPRSTGSILKPFLYCAMIQEGEILPHALIPDLPVNINGFSPQNFNMQFDGAVPASQAIARSLNVPAVQMLRTYGLPKFHDLLKKAGMTTLNQPAAHYGLSLILGGAEGTLWEVASIYRKMAKVLRDDAQMGDFPFHPPAVWHAFEAIKEVNRPEEIDWRSIPSMQQIAWKTGTSYGFRDAWAVGATPQYVVGVWVGNANGEGKPGLVGAKTAAPLLFEVFNLLPSSPWFSRPSQLVEAEVCRESGHLKGRYCTNIDTLLVPIESVRSASCPYHILVTLTPDEKYRVYAGDPKHSQVVTKSFFVLPPAWAWYYKQRHPLYESPPPFFTGSSVGDNDLPMQFIYPSDLYEITLPKQLDGSRGSVSFRLAHNNPKAVVYWHLDEEYLCATEDFHETSISPKSGEHTIFVIDNQGYTISVRFNIHE